MRSLERYPLEDMASRVGTPFYFYEGDFLRASTARFANAALGPGSAARYAMKANSGHKILEVMRDAGMWIDAVSGNEVLRARRAGFPGGAEPPVILLTSDVFRDNALETVLRERVTPNVGSPGMLGELRSKYIFTGIYPLATLAIDKDFLREKWRRTHPAFAGEEFTE